MQVRTPHQSRNKHLTTQRLVILGSYGLTIKSGVVTLAGAILRASEKTQWIHAPRCHALPVLRCTDDATIMLQPHLAAPFLRQLGNLSPMFSRLWNEPPADSSKKESNATFQIVSSNQVIQLCANYWRLSNVYHRFTHPRTTRYHRAISRRRPSGTS